MINHH